MNSSFLGIFLICASTNLIFARSLSGEEKPFTWSCGTDICTKGIHYCDDISDPAVCERCNEDVCNRQIPPNQCLQTCHQTKTSTPATSTCTCTGESTQGSWVIPVIVVLAVDTMVLFIVVIVVIVICRRQQTKTATVPVHPTVTQEDTSMQV